MKLNCRPNQLAMLVKDISAYHNDEERPLLRSGFICRTVRLEHDAQGNPAWEVEDKVRISVQFSCGCKATAVLHSIADAFLRPLPDLPDEEEELRLTDLREPA